jgi:hypothetical protein
MLAASALPAQAHVLGPQYVAVFDSISPPAAGVVVSVAQTGSAPELSITVGGSDTLELLGAAGEPFAEIGPKGVSVNQRSPTWYRIRHLGVKPLKIPAGVGASLMPKWIAGPQDQDSELPKMVYLEPRAEWPGARPPAAVQRAGKPATIFHWSIPGNYQGHLIRILGHVDWKPAPFDPEIVIFGGFAAVLGLYWMWGTRKRLFGPFVRAASKMRGALHR